MQIEPTAFRVVQWAAWSADYNSGEVQGVPQSLKRRIGKTGQAALASAWSLDAKDARIIFSSRHGDFNRSFSLMDSLAKTGEVSPADFTLSVHHGLVGLLSIAQGNRKGHTAISAGTESFCYGLLEAIACLKANPKERVVLLHCDDPLPEPFKHFNEQDEQSIAIALLIEPGNQFSFSTTSSQGKQTNMPALDFLKILRGEASKITSNCETAAWHWQKN